MKQNKMTLTAALVLGGLMAFGPVFVTRADDAAPSTNAPAAKGEARGEKLKELIASLNLTPDQKSKVMAALKSQREQVKALQADTSLDEDAKRAKRKSIMEATISELKPVLSADQLAKLEAGFKQMRGGAGGGAGRAAAGGTKPLPTTPQN